MRFTKDFEKQGLWLFRYRSFLPVLFLILTIAIYWNLPFGTGKFYLTKTYELLCLFVSLLGLGVRALTIGYAYKASSGRNTTKQIAEALNTKDIYSTVRHPLYFGNFLMWLGLVMFAGSFWLTAVFALVFWLFYERIIAAEEDFCIGKFGDQYLPWAKKTPAFFPNMFLYKSSGKKFDWYRVFRQEKNGLLAIFLVFNLFEFIEGYRQGEAYSFYEHQSIFITGLIISACIYVIFKILTKFYRRRQK